MTKLHVDFPFHIDKTHRTATVNRLHHIRDMIEQFLFTNPGERVNRPEFGSGMLHMVFEPNSSQLAGLIQQTIQAGLQHWLGDLIQVNAVDVRSHDSALVVVVQYTVLETGENRVDEFERSSV